ncbi:MAG: hypothetical protein KJ709_08330 [Nanoarchaeota archaeon]|nr:hypothetical protein [Nanoarchaeota archaeon]
MAFTGDITAMLAYAIIINIIMIPLSGLLLWLTTKIFSLKNSRFLSALVVAAIVHMTILILSIPRLIFIKSIWINIAVGLLIWLTVSFFLAWMLVKRMYGLSWGWSILIWLVWSAFTWVISFIIGLFVSVIIGVMLFKSAAGLFASNMTTPTGKAIFGMI